MDSKDNIQDDNKKDTLQDASVKRFTSHSSIADDGKVVRMRRRPANLFVIMGLAALVLLFIGGYFYWNRTFNEYEADSKVERTDETAMEYVSFQGGFIKYNVDGITFEDRTGTIVWTEAFTMTSPKVVNCGEYAAITDVGNNQYTLYNASRKIISVTTDYPITDIQVAEQGLVAVVLEEEKVNYIVAYDRSGQKCVEIKTTISKNGYPMSIALSMDGKKLVASYVTIESSQVESALTFYNFGDVGKNEVDRQVGYKKFENQLFPKMAFVNNDTICAFGDTSLLIYSMKQKPEEVANKKLKDKAKSIFFNEEYVGYVSRKDDSKKSDKGNYDELTREAEENDITYVMHAFNLNGREVLTQDIKFAYTNIHSTKDEIIILSDNRCEIYKYNGFEKFKHNFDDGISDLFPTNRRNHYVLITKDATQMIHLK